MGITVLIVISIFLGIILLIFIGIYNSLINRKNQIANAEGSVDAMLKKRFDLIPNLVAKMFGFKERQVFVANETEKESLSANKLFK